MATIRHTRTRSAGIPIASSSAIGRPPTRDKPAAGPSPPPAAGAVSSSAPKTTGAGAGGTSHLGVFFTNLRLLDLDQRPDWPKLTTDTFVAPTATGAGPLKRGTAALGQKKRAQGVEWVLYHLFALWDPEETRSKLKPFFPPGTQVQSTNLRAAILRALEQAKKNGVLGRDAIVRKTMLDECRGDRLEEVLAAFSSAVLKKTVGLQVSEGTQHVPVALGLALEKRGYKDEKTDINALSLAHRASLHGLLAKKRAAAGRYRDFSDLLTVKERGITRRKEEEHADTASEETALSEDARLGTLRQVRNNWAGNERWMDALLYGDSDAGGGLVGVDFERVWRRVEQGRLAELEESQAGLLEQLEQRVRTQKDRLRKWDTFREKKFGERPASPAKKRAADQKTRGIDFGFAQHENLHLGRMSPSKLATTKQGFAMSDEYKGLVDGLHGELAALAHTDENPLAFLRKRAPRRLEVPQTSSADPANDGNISEMSDLDDAEVFPPDAPVTAFQAKLDSAKRLPVRPNLSHRGDSQASSRGSSGSVTHKREVVRAERAAHDVDTSNEIPQSKRVDMDIRPARLSVQTTSREQRTVPPLRHSTQPEQQQHPPSPTQDRADQILESMNDASPSPTKRTKPRHTLSLAERTRLSMARGPNVFLDDDEPELPAPPAGSLPSAATTAVDVTTPPGDDTAAAAAEDLASRTRRSMAGFDKARQKAQLERRRSLRRSKLPPRREGSYFPRVDEQDEAQDQSVLAEELMGGAEDAEAVFRSRPKIKASPIPSPTKEWDDEY